MAVLIAVVVASALAGVGSRDDKGDVIEEWSSYENREHGYQIRYSADWTLEEEPTKCDGTFCAQSIELKRDDEASVFVFVNFQGGWCETFPAPVVKDIVVSGYDGKEYRCQSFTIRSFGPGDSVIRYFPGAPGKINYLILGQAHIDMSEVEAILETFRFVE